MLFLLNICFYLSLILSLSLFLILYFLFFFPVILIYPRFGNKLFHYAIWLGGRLLLKVLVRPIIKTSFNNQGSWNELGPCVIVTNHNSSSDAFFLGLLPAIEAVMIVKSWPFKIPLIGFMAKKAGYIRMEERLLSEYLEEGGGLLKRGISIALFPEGTRAGDGLMSNFYSLGFKIAMKAGVPIVPMVLTGNRRSPAKGSLLLKRTKVTLTALSPITPEIYKGMNSYTVKNITKELIQNHLLEFENKQIPSLISRNEMLSMIPHKPPMLLIDKLIQSKEDFAIVEVVIKADNIFHKGNGYIDESIYPELIAQAAAINNAYQKRKVQSGFIVSFRDFKIDALCKIGQMLTIKIQKIREFEDLSTIKGSIYYQDILFAEGEVGIWKTS